MSAIRRHLFHDLQTKYKPNVPLKELLSYEQPNKYIVSNTEYSTEKTLTPVLTANKGFILGYTDEVDGIYNKGQCIIFDDFTLDCKFVNFPFKVKSSAIKILTAKSTVNLRYVYEYLRYLELATSEHKRHYLTEIEPKQIIIPSHDEMKNIGSLFDILEKRLNTASQLLYIYQTEKRYLQKQLFI